MASQRVEIPVGMREATARSPFVSSQSAINCYVERDPEPGIPDAIYGGPGLVEFATCGSGPIRGLHDFNGTLLAVSGATLYTVTSAGVATAIGSIAGYDPVIIANNGEHAAIVSDSTSYVYDLTTLSQINDPQFLLASSVAFLKQVLIYTKRDSGIYFTSNLADAENYDALDVATAEAKPDKLRRVMVSGNEALLFGEKSVEGVYFSGKPDGVPLSPTQTYLDYGLAGRDAACGIDNTIAWLSNLLDFRTLRDQTPLAIADPAITEMVQQWTNPETARAFSYAIGGHEWMAVRHADGCVVWDATTKLWSRRESHGLDTWRVSCSEWAYNKNIMGDAIDGRLWRLDPNVYAEGSDPMVRTLVSRTIGPGGRPFTLNSVELEIETGVGLATGQGSDPKVWMELSRDGGRTFGTRMLRSMGAMGERTKRVVWTGPFGDFNPKGGVIKFGCSDPVRFVITAAHADIQVNRP